MLEERGIVIELDNQFAIVKTIRHSSCGNCAANKGCGTASLSSFFGQKANYVRVVNKLAAKVGDQVVIGLQEQALLKSSLMLYLLPLLCLFIAVLGYEFLVTTFQWPNYELLTVLVGLSGLFFGLKWVKYTTANLLKDARYHPVMLKME
jgi:sigma-E factor negative regulatory protein RseC